MSLRGRDHEDYPVTVNDYVRLNPDESFLDEPYDENWPLTLKLAWLSSAALTPASTSVAGGQPVPNPQPGAPETPPPSAGRSAAGLHPTDPSEA